MIVGLWMGILHLFAWAFELVAGVAIVALAIKMVREATKHFRPVRRLRRPQHA